MSDLWKKDSVDLFYKTGLKDLFNSLIQSGRKVKIINV